MRRNLVSGRLGSRSLRSRGGFTLVEVLVVVGIIALLIGILVPSMSKAREQARVAACQANCKQLANMLAAYQNEHKGWSPVMFNYNANSRYSAHARHCWISVALRKYAQNISNLPEDFNPDTTWDDAKLADYQQRLLDDFYVCPFVRSKSPSTPRSETVTIRGSKGTRLYTAFIWEGRYETYHTFLWQDVLKNRVPRGELHPNDPTGSMDDDAAGDGRPKYSVLTFNRARTDDANYPMPGGVLLPNGQDVNATNLPMLHRQWNELDAQRYKGGSLSAMTTIYCNQGTHMGLDRSIRNPDSHRGGLGPGTNAAFADSHVEWVKGTQIGWP